MILIGKDDNGHLRIYRFKTSPDEVSMVRVGRIKLTAADGNHAYVHCEHSAALADLIETIQLLPRDLASNLPRWTHE